jgi:hypothetical protein
VYTLARVWSNTPRYESRIRGIYATALTHLFRDTDHTVVQASPPIRKRFGDQFAVEESDIAIKTTDDRQGIDIHGDSTVVSTATTHLVDLETDTFILAIGRA